MYHTIYSQLEHPLVNLDDLLMWMLVCRHRSSRLYFPHGNGQPGTVDEAAMITWKDLFFG